MDDVTLPKLRSLDLRPHHRDGQTFILVKDPLGISKATLLIPQPLASAMLLCDGSRDIQSICAALALHGGVWIPPLEIKKLLSVLDDHYFLENERYLDAQYKVLEAYRQAPYRSSCCAGQVYPLDAEELRQYLQSFIQRLDGTDQKTSSWAVPSRWCGLISPHIDYARGGSVYAKLWTQAKNLVQEAELVIILGTDHHGSEDLLTLTRQNYATPFGIMRTHQGVVDAVASALGEGTVFAGELRHQNEHSVELAAVWLQYIRADGDKDQLNHEMVTPVEIVPVLTGSLSQVSGDAQSLAADDMLNQFIKTTISAASGRRVLVVAAGDLSHVGPAFDGPPLNFVDQAILKSADEELLNHVCTGDADSFYDSIQKVGDCNNVCGVTPIYLTLRLLHPARGEKTGYALCPADEQGNSFVSICGVIFE